MGNLKQADKARHYIDALDKARCNGQWQEITELTRKVEKHAPARQCLIVTARTEREVAEQWSNQLELVPQPTQIHPSAATLHLWVPGLVKARDQEVDFKEDPFQAQVCLTWLYITLGKVEQALSTAPDDKLAKDLAHSSTISSWTHVCIVKAAYIKGLALENKEGKAMAAYKAYGSVLPYLSSISSTIAKTTQHCHWREMLLGRFIMLASNSILSHVKNPTFLFTPAAAIPAADLLVPFRAYFQNWKSPTSSSTQRSGILLPPWKAYYTTISFFLHAGLVEPMFGSRLEQCIELKEVEGTYANGLIQSVDFPRADQSNALIEACMHQIMANWRVMGGPTWQEQDLGEGGRAVLGQGIIDILYKAASKTFHSTAILRHLFTVHTALAEFHVASKALDSYLEIVFRGKARVEKSGKAEVSLDSNTQALSTAAAGIAMLCKHGRRTEVEKSLKIAEVVEGWLTKWVLALPRQELVSAPPTTRKPAVTGKASALGFYAVGVSQSSWARFTYETESRDTLRTKAIASFRKALEPRFGQEENIEILYSLSFVLAETRDLETAIIVVKQAIHANTKQPATNPFLSVKATVDAGEGDEIHPGDQRSLVTRCWHLLVLLLSARGEFLSAWACCQTAAQSLGYERLLYGMTAEDSPQNFVLSERKALIELKMTQLVLSELLDDDPEETVNSCRELLHLYNELFNHVAKPSKQASVSSTSPPATANASSRSFRGSILGLQKSGSQIHFFGRHESNKLHKKNSHKPVISWPLSRNPSPSRPATSEGPRQQPSSSLPTPKTYSLPTPKTHALARSHGESNPNNQHYESDNVGVAISHDLPSIPGSPTATTSSSNPLHTIQSATQNMNHRNPNKHPPLPKPPASRQKRGSKMIAWPLPISPTPEPHYTQQEETRHAHTILVQIWLFISNLYRQADMPAGARAAIKEAVEIVKSIEASIAVAEGSSAANFSKPGYSGLKASDELQADVLNELAELHLLEKDKEMATICFESAVLYWPDHVDATIGLSKLLLDQYIDTPEATTRYISAVAAGKKKENNPWQPTLGDLKRMPSTMSNELARIAARDRAMFLLSILTKGGRGWDNSKAWYVLSTAYQCSNQMDKEMDALHWVVKLEKKKPIREWAKAL